MTTEPKTIPLDRTLTLIPALNGGWMIQVGYTPNAIPEVWAFSTFADALRALVEAGNADRDGREMSVVMPGVPLDEMPRSVAEAVAGGVPGRFLRDLHLEPGDVVKATTEDRVMDVMPGETHTVKRLNNGVPAGIGMLTIKTHRGIYPVDTYTEAKFVVVHRAPKPEAL